jgi:hypothetical protein
VGSILDFFGFPLFDLDEKVSHTCGYLVHVDLRGLSLTRSRPCAKLLFHGESSAAASPGS